MTRASGVGSLPGDDARAYGEAVRLVLDELPGLPHLPELPGRGVAAGPTGRTLGLISDLGADLQPAGWRLTGGDATTSGVDHRRARSLLAQDLDALEERAQELTAPLKVQVTGPWTLAATVERPRGDRVLADHGARRELAQALAEGLGAHVADLRRRVPGAPIVVQLDEPSLPAVMAARVPTASGFGRHRAVDPPKAAPALEWVVSAVVAAGADPVVHCCREGMPFDLLERTGAPGLSVDLDRLGTEDLDHVAAALEAGRWLFLGVVPATRPADPPDERRVTERVERLLDMLGLDPGERLVLTPACGLAEADPAWVRTAYSLVRAAARNLTVGG